MKREEDKQKQILIVDDETRMRDLLRLVLESRGYSVAEAEDGLQALKLFVAEPPDMVILDVMMPVMDGFICCRKLREYSACPILMLTAKGEDYDQVRGLDCGADDYIVKPFAPMVLAARVEALFRRSAAMPRNVFGSMRIDTAAREVTVDGVSVPLSRDQILEFVWGYDYLGSSNTVDTHINRLRSKLGKCGSYITTLRGFGYRFEIGT
jgi:DNA-binding response OmpR family regulator